MWCYKDGQSTEDGKQLVEVDEQALGGEGIGSATRPRAGLVPELCKSAAVGFGCSTKQIPVDIIGKYRYWLVISYTAARRHASADGQPIVVCSVAVGIVALNVIIVDAAVDSCDAASVWWTSGTQLDSWFRPARTGTAYGDALIAAASTSIIRPAVAAALADRSIAGYEAPTPSSLICA